MNGGSDKRWELRLKNGSVKSVRGDFTVLALIRARMTDIRDKLARRLWVIDSSPSSLSALQEESKRWREDA